MISSHLFKAFLECPTKCWLRAQNEPATGNLYAEWRRAQNERYRKEWLERRVAIVAEADRVLSPTFEANPKEATWRFAVDMRVQANDLECRIPAVERARSEGCGRCVQFIPHRFEFSNKLTKQHKLMLAFDALVLSHAIGRNRIARSIQRVSEHRLTEASVGPEALKATVLASQAGGPGVYPQQCHHEDQDRIKPDFHDVGTPIPPLLYRLLFHGGSPWVANRTHGSPHPLQNDSEQFRFASRTWPSYIPA
jgi:hypothetical protein